MGFRFRKSSAGERPSCLGVTRKAPRATSKSESFDVLRMCLTDLTAASERPFEAGFATEDSSWTIPYEEQKLSNSSEVRFEAPSVKRVFGDPKKLNQCLRTVMMADEVVEETL